MLVKFTKNIWIHSNKLIGVTKTEQGIVLIAEGNKEFLIPSIDPEYETVLTFLNNAQSVSDYF